MIKKLKSIICFMVLFLFVGMSFCSCSKKKEPSKLFIDTFRYKVENNISDDSNELVYDVSFDIKISVEEKSPISGFDVRIDGKKAIRLVVDYCNTEDVTYSKPKEKLPYAKLRYSVQDGVNTMKASVQLKIYTVELMDDINKFLKIDCIVDDSYQIIDKNNLLNDGFKMNYSDDSVIHYAFDELSESYSVVSVFTKSKSFEIPATYKGYPVRKISNGAFRNCSSLASIELPDTITSIGQEAFIGCSNLTSITIPKSVTSIGKNAFQNCFCLLEIYNFSSLKVIIGSSGNGYLAYYAKVIHTKVEPSILKKTDDDFVYYKENQDNYYLLSYVGEETELTLPNSIEGQDYSIYRYAFYNWQDLVSVSSYEGITEIGASAFEGCTNLKKIELPTSITTIGKKAFSGCDNIKSATIPAIAISFISKSSLEEVTINGGDTIPNYAFKELENLKSVVIGDTITSIGKESFHDCDNLVSVVVGDNVTRIGEYAFSLSDNIEKMILPSGLTSMGSSCLPYAQNLKYNEFDNAYYLGNEDNPYVVLVKAKSDTIESCEINPKAKLIYQEAFAWCKNLKSITISSNVTSIGSYAFQYCHNLLFVTIGNGVTSIGNGAFDGCNSITSITMPSSVKSIGLNAFSGCSSLSNVVIPNSVTSIENGTFYGCNSLKTITIPDGVTSIGNSTFSDCNNLKSIIIPTSVTSIGEKAFRDSSNFEKIYYKGTHEMWNKIKIGYYNSELKSVRMYFYSETKPADGGHYWHYVNGIATEW